jgi:hypothetical protein
MYRLLNLLLNVVKDPVLELVEFLKLKPTYDCLVATRDEQGVGLATTLDNVIKGRRNNIIEKAILCLVCFHCER